MLPVRQVSCVTERCIRQGLDLPIALFLIGLTPVLMPAHTNELCNFIIISSVQQTPQNKKLSKSWSLWHEKWPLRWFTLGSSQYIHALTIETRLISKDGSVINKFIFWSYGMFIAKKTHILSFWFSLILNKIALPLHD